MATKTFKPRNSGKTKGQPPGVYKTALGRAILGQAEDVLQSPAYTEDLKGKVSLIFTSPPFPLNRKKRYGNEQGEAYLNWLADFAPLFKKVLKPKGSIVLELGNAWEAGRPVMSTLALKALLAFLERGEFTLCQQFVWYNPARLPSPAQWVNVERIRVKDAYTHLWWMALTDRPHADNRQVLTKYSESMEKLLERKSYNTGKRPSEHHIGEKSFLKKQCRRYSFEPDHLCQYAGEFGLPELLPYPQAPAASCPDAERACGVLHQVPDQAQKVGTRSLCRKQYNRSGGREPRPPVAGD